MSGALHIRVNGEERTVDAGDTVQGLLRALEITESRIAVELNRTVLPRDRYITELQDGDVLEIVTFVGGGLNHDTKG